MRFWKRCIFCIMTAFLFILPPAVQAATDFSSDVSAINRAAQSVLMLEVQDVSGTLIATGSGFVVFDHYLLTNYHVIQDAYAVTAVGDDEKRYQADAVLCADRAKDIAILRLQAAEGLEPLEIYPDNRLQRGANVIAIGSPIGLKNTVSSGIISSVYEEDGVSWIQITAPISHGSSGGALFNDKGKVIGITSASYVNGQNLNLAINIGEAAAMFNAWDGQYHSIIAKPVTAAFNYAGVYPTDEEAVLEAYADYAWECSNCGKANTTAFCLECGSPRPLWICVCGEVSTAKFCGKCGMSFVKIDQTIEEIQKAKGQGRYDRAVELLESLGKFNSVALSTSAGDHFRAGEETQKTLIEWTEDLISKAMYPDAVSVIGRLNDKAEARSRIRAINTAWVEKLIGDGAYEEAIAKIDGMEETEALKETRRQAYVLLGDQKAEAGAYKEAAEAYLKADGYPGSEEKLQQYKSYLYPIEVTGIEGFGGTFEYGRAAVQGTNGKFGFIDTLGRLVIDCQYDKAQNFTTGCVTVTVQEGEKQKKGLIDPDGNYVIPLGTYENIGSYSEEYCTVKQDGKFGFVDKTGKMVIEPVYDSAAYFQEGLASVCVDGKWGAIDTAGNMVIQPQFSKYFAFSEGIALINNGNEIFFIDTSGRKLFGRSFMSAQAFRNGLSACSAEGKDENSLYHLDVINKQGETVFTKDCEVMGEYADGIALFKMNGLYGAVDQTGKEIIPPSYTGVMTYRGGFYDGYLVVQKDGKLGMIDRDNNVVLPFEYDQLRTFVDGYALAKKGDTILIIDQASIAK